MFNLKPLLIVCAICCCCLYCLCCSGKERHDFFEVKTGEKTWQIFLEHISDSFNQIVVKTFKDGELMRTSTYRLPYPVYRFDVGDVTGNGVPDIAVGVIKTTMFDPKTAKRPFLFKISDDGKIQKLWMGSRVAQPLEDFILTKNETPARVLTIERERSGNFLVAVYRYKGFGLEHNGYIKREIPLKEAYEFFHKQQCIQKAWYLPFCRIL